MDSVLTLVAGARASPLDARIVDAVRKALNDQGADTLAPDWLSPGRACDLLFAKATPEKAEAAARAAIGAQPIDIAVQPALERRKQLLVADMDSTIVDGEMLDELSAFAGVKAEVAALTAKAMNGEIPYAESLRRRVAMLTGLTADTLEKTLAGARLNPGARTLVATMRAHGAATALVSSGFTWFTSRIARQAGFENDTGNEIEIVDGRLTGRVVEPIFDKDSKRAFLLWLADRRALPLHRTLAVGDGANDIEMVRAAGLGVAYRAKPALQAAARVRIDHADLTALLYLQGYRQDEFAA